MKEFFGSGFGRFRLVSIERFCGVLLSLSQCDPKVTFGCFEFSADELAGFLSFCGKVFRCAEPVRTFCYLFQ